MPELSDIRRKCGWYAKGFGVRWVFNGKCAVPAVDTDDVRWVLNG